MLKDMAQLSPHKVAQLLVDTRRQRAEHESKIKDLAADEMQLNNRLLELVEAGEYPAKATVDGCTLYVRTQVWASAKDGDHERLARTLAELGMDEYLPKTVHSGSISAYVREHLSGDDTASLEERLASLDPRLKDALNISERTQMAFNGI